MKRTINGVTCNTETAQIQGEYWTRGVKRGDLNYYEETLYKTKKGQYFLYVFGGAHIIPNKLSNGMTSGSEYIKLINEKEAHEWMETKKMEP